MATTTNYSWSTPDDTALVKDGAAAIRSLGTAIDTTVFTNAGAAIAKTIVDAKGDIVAGTAADTVARLAVGANDTVLTADSSTATGLKWAAPSNDITYTTWTPTLNNLTIGNGTGNFRYAQVGKAVFIDINIVLGTTSSVGDVQISLPVAPKYIFGLFYGSFLDTGTAVYQGGASIETIGATDFLILKCFLANATYVTFTQLTNLIPFTWTTNDKINFQFVYEAA